MEKLVQEVVMVFMQEEQAAGSGCGMRRFDGDGIK